MLGSSFSTLAVDAGRLIHSKVPTGKGRARDRKLLCPGGVVKLTKLGSSENRELLLGIVASDHITREGGGGRALGLAFA